MASIDRQGWTARGGSRLAWPARLLALLLVLHGAAQIGHYLPGGNLRPLLAALVPVSGPTFRPFGFSGQVPSLRSEARSLAGPPDRASEQDPHAAILPLALALTGQWTLQASWPCIEQQPRPKAGRPFEARAPPTTA